MACQARRGVHIPMDELGPWVQDALDLIEFANGSTASPWGGRRAAMGHPEPFHLKYLAVGNEQWLQEYFDRYEVFYRALKAKYPEIRIISSAGPLASDPLWHFAWDKFRSGTAADVVDEHYYVAPRWFLANIDRYAGYDRKGPKIFLGEFAAHEPDRRNDLRSAVAEAAYMTGLVRNADVVEMASYAPLFGCYGHAQWRPDLIWFDNSRVVLTPNYFAQALFSQNRPDRALPTRVESPVDTPESKGRIGVGSFRTVAEYTDIRVIAPDGRAMFQSDFSTALNGWEIAGGDWVVTEGALRQKSGEENVFALAGDFSWGDYTLSLKARKVSGDEGFMVLFHTRAPGSRMLWNIGGWGNTAHAFSGGGLNEDQVRGSIETGRWYDLRVELRGATVKGFIDGKLVQQTELKPVATLFAVAGKDLRSGELVLEAVNAASEPRSAKINFAGLTKVLGPASLTVLTGDPEDENSLGQIPKVAPRAGMISPETPQFEHVFPPNSITVMRLRAR